MALNKRMFYDQNNYSVGLVTVSKYKKRNSLIIHPIVLFQRFLDLKVISKKRNLMVNNQELVAKCFV